MRLYRAHGLGNDYLVLEDGPALTAGLVRAVCDRHTGVGADGILEPVPASGADHGVRIWNPDGSVAERSGNGLRIMARWLHDRGAGRAFSISTGGGVVKCRVSAVEVAIDMGRATFEPSEIPTTAPGELVHAPHQVAHTTLHVTAVGMGNPHCVILRDEEKLDVLPWKTWGLHLETDPLFPNRTNVQVARVVAPDRLEARVWERGAGVTRASGTSACAVAAAAVRAGRVPPGPITVQMPGGSLRVTVHADWSIVLTGPVEVVGRFEVDASWLADRLTT